MGEVCLQVSLLTSFIAVEQHRKRLSDKVLLVPILMLSAHGHCLCPVGKEDEDNQRAFRSTHSWENKNVHVAKNEPQISRSGSSFLPVEENILLHVTGRVPQTLTGGGLVVEALIPQQTNSGWFQSDKHRKHSEPHSLLWLFLQLTNTFQIIILTEPMAQHKVLTSKKKSHEIFTVCKLSMMCVWILTKKVVTKPPRFNGCRNRIRLGDEISPTPTHGCLDAKLSHFYKRNMF